MSRIARARAVRASLAGLMLLVVFPLPAAATHWAPTSYSVALTTAPNYRTAGDSFYVRAIFSWNSSAASTMRSYAQQNGYRFTSDARDLSCCVHAQWNQYSTTLPNPVYDADDDDGDLVYEEAELTANSSTFPTAGTSYNTYLKFSRWFPACNDYFCTEYWEAGPGTMRQIGQMSQYIWPEWDSVGFTDLVMGQPQYGYKTPPSGAGAQEVAAPQAAASVGTSAADAVLRPDLSRGLDVYAAEARAAGTALLADGQPAQGIATFSRPLSTADLGELQRAGSRSYLWRRSPPDLGRG